MKRLSRLLLIILLSILFLVKTTTVKASSPDYKIEDVTTKADIQKDGSLIIERKVSYDFADDAHGVYYRQNLNSDQTLEDPDVEIISDGTSTPVEDNVNRENNTYQLTEKDNSYQFKVFHKIKAYDTITVIYRYRITNAVKNWRDTAELNFKIIGDGWDKNLDYVSVEVTFPEKVKHLKAWAHGDPSGEISVSPDIIEMSANNLRRNRGIEVHAIFPNSVTPNNKNVSNKNHKQFVLDQEAKLVKRANRKRRLHNLFIYGMAALSMVLPMRVILKASSVKAAGVKLKKKSEIVHNFEIPSISPVMAQVLDRGFEPDTQGFIAYLMYLAGKHKIKIEEYERQDPIKRTYYRISLIDPTVINDNELISYLFNKVGDGNSFTTFELNNAQSDELYERFKNWKNQWYKQAFAKKYFDEKNVEVKEDLLLAEVLMSILSIVCAAIAWLFGRLSPQILLVSFVMIVVEIIIVSTCLNRVSIYTLKGADETNKIRGFKSMLQDIGRFNMREVGELILWEDIMPFAVAFDLSDKVIEQLKIDFSKEELEQTSFYAYTTFYSTESDGFEHNFISNFNLGTDSGSDSSSFGDSGGFSDGSSDGFGGGSGGGAF